MCNKHSRSEQMLVREAECHDKLSLLYSETGDRGEAKRHLDEVKRLKKKLGKDMLRGLVCEGKDAAPKSRSSKGVKHIFSILGR